jgi:hypothetical protein
MSLAAAAVAVPCQGAKLIEVRTVDDEHLMVHWQDGTVEYKDDGEGKGALMGHETGGGDVLKTFDPPLDIPKATSAASYSLVSSDDGNYSNPIQATHAYRKTKVNGNTNKWPEPPFTLEHTIFLKLPRKLEQGKHYTLTIDPAVSTDTTSRDFTFDAYSSVTEALHVNLIGYNPAHTAMKSADLYMWLGDGGARDYSAYAGRPVFLVDVATGQKHAAGKVAFWKKGGADFGGHNLTKSDVWTCDFSDFTGTGKFRLAIEGIGCSPEFQIAREAFFQPYRFSVRGFYYMRIGEPKTMTPIPRQPRFIPDVDPPDFKVYRTTFEPGHPDWKALRGDVWDRKEEWAKYKEPGDPTNPDAYGGHSDATDWDRHGGHVSIIWDMLLPYYLSLGKLNEDNLDIRESANGIPDIIDESLNEIDFWLRLRDGKGGYAFGINNPGPDHKAMYQAGARPYMAWVSALNCAMVADCFRIGGNEALRQKYQDEAIKAWNFANDEDLDFSFGIGNGATRGRDLKMMAGAFLYNLTGDRKYEDAMAADAVVKNQTTSLDERGKYCQFWGVAAYLMCAREKWQPIHHPQLLANMKAAILHEAVEKNVNPSQQRPSRRSSDNAYGWFQSTQMVHPLIIGHAISTDPAQQEQLLRAMILEADYGLGRNPMNMVQMTGLGSRHVDDIYTTGRNDGTPGVHPGHTPYMNAGAWGRGFMADPMWYASKGYPTWDKWPHGEALWPAPYCFSNNEFTPQQTMRGKMALLGYLWALAKE